MSRFKGLLSLGLELAELLLELVTFGLQGLDIDGQEMLLVTPHGGREKERK